ncbi:DUF3237 domain-containing protein [Paraliomyxa miuraensis]|uniref:DUF3237 domain-containing protein n=1 Tax=Paraliomyxa miuraensis TaxID=376150 RepID=UPI002257573B|nr:DUF3237 domain-containing protein [Paraliomyxa miuraensis]MCX4247521.1 DUF3237 domain-containing protein [Paraliomyxa miuraensis]
MSHDAWLARSSVSSELLFEMFAELHPPIDHGDTPNGHRFAIIVGGGRFSGPKLEGTVVTHSGGDWGRLRPDGTLALDVRLTLRTHDGAHIFMTYGGRLVAQPELLAQVLAYAQPTGPDPESYYFRTNPLFETGDPRYAWLNGVVAVGYGKTGDGGVTYRVFAIT